MSTYVTNQGANHPYSAVRSRDHPLAFGAARRVGCGGLDKYQILGSIAAGKSKFHCAE